MQLPLLYLRLVERCENICNVILVLFNPIFDGLQKVHSTINFTTYNIDSYFEILKGNR
jgi:hypothetical protein